MSHVVYIVKQPLSLRDHERYGIETVISQGYKVTVLDVSSIVVPKLVMDRNHYGDYKDFDIKTISSHSDLNAAYQVFLNADIVFFLSISWHFTRREVPILRLIKKAGVPYLISVATSLPGDTNADFQISAWTRIKDIWSRLAEIDLLNSIVVRLPLPLLGIKPADAVVHGGTRTLGPCALGGSNSLVIKAHAPDYDIYMETKKLALPATETAVFLDQFYPFHQDQKADYNLRNIQEPEIYYKQLRDLFTYIEKKLGLKVVIAAHPRANYDKLPDYFDGREVHKGKTAQLIESSRFAMSHNSVAFGLAVMFHKPIMIIVTKEMYRRHVWHKRWYDSFSRALETPLYFMDDIESINFANICNTNDLAYSQYMEEHVKIPGTSERPFWDIVMNELRDNGLL